MSVIEKEKPRVEYSQINENSFPAIPTHNPVGVVAQESFQNRTPHDLVNQSSFSYPPQPSIRMDEYVKENHLFAAPPASTYDSKVLATENHSLLLEPPKPRHRKKIKIPKSSKSDTVTGVSRSTELEYGAKMAKAIDSGIFRELQQLCKECPNAVNFFDENGSLMARGCKKGSLQLIEELLKTNSLVLRDGDLDHLDGKSYEFCFEVWRLILKYIPPTKIPSFMINDELREAINDKNVELPVLMISHFPLNKDVVYGNLVDQITAKERVNEIAMRLFVIKLHERINLDLIYLLIEVLRKYIGTNNDLNKETVNTYVIRELGLIVDFNCKQIIEAAYKEIWWKDTRLAELIWFFRLLGIDEVEVKRVVKALPTQPNRPVK